eukprot:scaffold4412_cov71-Phaeocystis_antarctica.AAC.1
MPTALLPCVSLGGLQQRRRALLRVGACVVGRAVAEQLGEPRHHRRELRGGVALHLAASIVDQHAQRRPAGLDEHGARGAAGRVQVAVLVDDYQPALGGVLLAAPGTQLRAEQRDGMHRAAVLERLLRAKSGSATASLLARLVLRGDRLRAIGEQEARGEAQRVEHGGVGLGGGLQHEPREEPRESPPRVALACEEAVRAICARRAETLCGGGEVIASDALQLRGAREELAERSAHVGPVDRARGDHLGLGRAVGVRHVLAAQHARGDGLLAVRHDVDALDRRRRRHEPELHERGALGADCAAQLARLRVGARDRAKLALVPERADCRDAKVGLHRRLVELGRDLEARRGHLQSRLVLGAALALAARWSGILRLLDDLLVLLFERCVDCRGGGGGGGALRPREGGGHRHETIVVDVERAKRSWTLKKFCQDGAKSKRQGTFLVDVGVEHTDPDDFAIQTQFEPWPQVHPGVVRGARAAAGL